MHMYRRFCDDVGSVTLRAGWWRHHHVAPQKSFFHPGGRAAVNAPSVCRCIVCIFSGYYSRGGGGVGGLPASGHPITVILLKTSLPLCF